MRACVWKHIQIFQPPKMGYLNTASTNEDIGVCQGDALWILGGNELCWHTHSVGERLCLGSDAMAIGYADVVHCV